MRLSLRGKVAAGLSVVVVAVMATQVALTLATGNQFLTEMAGTEGRRLAEATYTGFQKPMSMGDNESVAELLRANAAAMPGVGVYIFDPSRTVVFASHPEQLGRPLAEFVANAELEAASADALLTGVAPGRVFVERSSQHEIMSIVRVIPNEGSCHHCHGPSRSVLGGMLVRLEIDDLRARLDRLRNRELALGLGGAVFILGLLYLLLSRLVLGPVQSLGRMVSKAISGDLEAASHEEAQAHNTRGQAKDDRDEIGALRMAFCTLIEGLRDTVAALKRAAAQVNAQVGAAHAATRGLATSAVEQASSVAETTATIEEVRQTGIASNKNAAEIVEISESSLAVARDGQAALSKTVDEIRRMRDMTFAVAESIDRLRADVARVGEIIESVNKVAEQSNLLAVNASIEAAKAGEFGRGFAVVAQEVKSLANQSREATVQVRQTLGAISVAIEAVAEQTGSSRGLAETGVASIANTGTVIERLAAIIGRAAQSAKGIAVGAHEQMMAFEQITLAMQQISSVATEYERSTDQVDQANAALHALSAQLEELVARYRVG